MNLSREEFLLEIDTILNDFFSESGYPTDLLKHTKNMIEYFLPDHFLIYTPVLLPKFCKTLKPDISEEEQKMASLLSWICQMYQTYYTLTDDYLDDSDMRYGKPTWNKLHNNSKAVIIPDLGILRAIIFFTLQRKFAQYSTSMYLQILHLFLESDVLYFKGLRLEKHQLIEDLRADKITFETFNSKTFNLLFQLQGGPYFYLPFALALTIAGFKKEKNSELYSNIRTICDDYLILFKLTDDYNEIFSPSIDYDSSDTDIRTGQFTWLFLIAMESCVSRDEQVELLNNYGMDNDKSVNNFKQHLEKIGIHNLYKKYRQDLTANVITKTNSLFVDTKEVQEMVKVFFDYWKQFMC